MGTLAEEFTGYQEKYMANKETTEKLLGDSPDLLSAVDAELSAIYSRSLYVLMQLKDAGTAEFLRIKDTPLANGKLPSDEVAKGMTDVRIKELYGVSRREIDYTCQAMEKHMNVISRRMRAERLQNQ